MVVLNILLVTKKVTLLNHYVLSYLKWLTGYIKYFENEGKNMSFIIKYDDVLDKYNEIWDKIKETLSIKFHRIPVYDEQYMKSKKLK